MPLRSAAAPGSAGLTPHTSDNTNHEPHPRPQRLCHASDNTLSPTSVPGSGVPNDPAQTPQGLWRLGPGKNRRAPAVGCSAWFGGRHATAATTTTRRTTRDHNVSATPVTTRCHRLRSRFWFAELVIRLRVRYLSRLHSSADTHCRSFCWEGRCVHSRGQLWRGLSH